MSLKDYNEEFYTKNDLDRFDSANEILSIFFNYYRPQSIIDIGCGLGHWLKIAKDKGVDDIMGYDGHYVNTKALKIPKAHFQRHDFQYPLQTKKFDLAITIEVAEHLPREKAKVFVKSLTDASDIILFSAAAPYQGGTNHVNEKSPAYWANFFKMEGFVCFDFLRDLLWDNTKVNYIYAQNILVFVQKVKKNIFLHQGLQETQNPKLQYHPIFVEKKLTRRKKHFLMRKIVPLFIPSSKLRKKIRADKIVDLQKQ